MRQELTNLPIADYTYHLPPERIAEKPLEERDASRMLLYRPEGIQDARFSDLPHHLPAGTTLVLNNTRVLEARIHFVKPTGGVIEVFCLEPHQQPVSQALEARVTSTWKCLIGGASKWKPGQVLEKAVTTASGPVTLSARYTEKGEDYFLIEFTWTPGDLPLALVLEGAGQMPLPPYIKRAAASEDTARYQTVFNRHPGSVAAPTASLHFTPSLLERLGEHGITICHATLHVGAGTFKPVKSETIGGHTMHSEPFTVSRASVHTIADANSVVAVGTTSLRTLESLYWLGVRLLRDGDPGSWELKQWEAYELEGHAVDKKESLAAILAWMDQQGLEALHCRTGLLIVPGYRFRIPEGLITNFHQPQSTLLLLIAAFIGEDWKKVYGHALQRGYRFLSYGDSSLLWRSV